MAKGKTPEKGANPTENLSFKAAAVRDGTVIQRAAPPESVSETNDGFATELATLALAV